MRRIRSSNDRYRNFLRQCSRQKRTIVARSAIDRKMRHPQMRRNRRVSKSLQAATFPEGRKERRLACRGTDIGLTGKRGEGWSVGACEYRMHCSHRRPAAVLIALSKRLLRVLRMDLWIYGHPGRRETNWAAAVKGNGKRVVSVVLPFREKPGLRVIIAVIFPT